MNATTEPVRLITPTMVSNHRIELYALKKSLDGKGPLELEGLDLQTVGEGLGGAAFPALLERGRADAGYGGLSIVIREPDLKFIPVRLTGPVGLQRGNVSDGSQQVLLVRQGSEVQSIDDLHGCVIGVNGLKPITICALKILLSKVMGFELDYEFQFRVDTDYASLLKRLDRGDVDAVLTYENFTAALLQAGAYRAVFDVAMEWRRAYGHDLVSTAGFAAERFAVERPDTCREVAVAVAKSVEHADAHLDETCAAVAEEARKSGESNFSNPQLLADVYRRWSHHPMDEDVKRNIIDYLWSCYELGLLADEPRKEQLFL